jgi:hypothetical protein
MGRPGHGARPAGERQPVWIAAAVGRSVGPVERSLARDTTVQLDDDDAVRWGVEEPVRQPKRLIGTAEPTVPKKGWFWQGRGYWHWRFSEWSVGRADTIALRSDNGPQRSLGDPV